MMQYGYPYYPQMYQQPMPQMQAPQQVQQIRNGGIVSVANEQVARNYPVAPGMTVTMRDESAPYLYEKTMGFSQLDQPIFRKARIVFEDDAQIAKDTAEKPKDPAVVYAELSQLEALRDAVSSEIRDLRSVVAAILNDKRRTMNNESTNNASIHAVRPESRSVFPVERNANASAERNAVPE